MKHALAGTLLLIALWIAAPFADPGPTAPSPPVDTEPAPARAPTPAGPDLAAATAEAGPSTISGQVFWPDGAPFDGGSILVKTPDSGSRDRPLARLRPRDGRFEFSGLADPSYRLLVVEEIREHRGHWVEEEVRGEWTVRPGDVDLRLDLPSSSGRPLLSVRVEDRAGRPVRDGSVIVDPIGDFDCVFRREVSIRDGFARCLLEVPARRVVLTVWDAKGADGARLGRYSGGPFEIAAEPIRLPVGRSLRGRVVSPEGEGVPGVGVAGRQPPAVLGIHGGWAFPDCVCGWIRTDAEGRFEVPHLGPGPVAIRVVVPPEWRTGEPWLDPEDLTVDADEDDLTIVLTRGVRAEIRVTDPDGNPIGRGCVDVPELPFERHQFRIVGGVAPMGLLDPGRRYTLQVWSTDDRSLSSRTIEDWTPVDTEVRLPWAPTREAAARPRPESEPSGDGRLFLRIDFGSERSRRDVIGAIVPEDGGPARAVRLSLPETTIEGLDAGKSYTLRVVGVGDGLVLEATGLRPRPDRVDLAMNPGLAITGTIELPPGADDASLYATRGNLCSSYRRQGFIRRADGSFELFGLLPGVWNFHVEVSAGGVRFGAALPLEAGGPPVRVALERLSDGR